MWTVDVNALNSVVAGIPFLLEKHHPHDGMLLSMKNRHQIDIISAVKKCSVLYGETVIHTITIIMLLTIVAAIYTTS